MSKLVAGLIFLLGTTAAQAGAPLDDIRGPVNQAIECMIKHGRYACLERGGPGCLNRFSASISGASARVRLPSGVAAG
jgi:hypothetical protein